MEFLQIKIRPKTMRPKTPQHSPPRTHSLKWLHPTHVRDVVSIAMKFVTRPRIDPMSLIASNRGLLGFNLIWMWGWCTIL
jgi:hypothetical protein